MRKIVFILVLLLIGIAPLIIPSYSEYISPKKQLESGVLHEDVICRENRVLVLRTNDSPACVKETTAQKTGWSIIATEFAQKESASSQQITTNDDKSMIVVDDDVELHILKNHNSTISEPNIQNAIKTNSQQERDNYLNSLQFGLVSDESFEGELYGFDQNLHLRQPAPAPMSVFFAPNHYSMNEDDLVGRQTLDHIIPQPLSTYSFSESGDDDNGATIDYREWLPTWIAPGYYLKWVDITQPEDQYHSGSEGKGEIKLTYIPKVLEFSEEITDKEFTDINMYVITVIIADNESTIYMKTSSEINVITRDGTTTDIIYENKWNGHVKYVNAARNDPAKHGVSYHSPNILIASGGNALTMQEHENIVTELFERYSNR